MNLFQTVTNSLGPNFVSQISGFLGESPENVNKATGTVIPTVIASLMRKSSTPEGANEIMNHIRDKSFDGRRIDKMSHLLDNNDTVGLKNMMTSGAPIINHLMGERAGGVMDFLSTSTGISRHSSKGLMNMVAPVIMSIVGKQVMSKGLSPAGITDMLMNQKDSVASHLPDQVRTMLGISSFDNMADRAARNFAGIRDDVEDVRREVDEPLRRDIDEPIRNIRDLDEPTYETVPPHREREEVHATPHPRPTGKAPDVGTPKRTRSTWGKVLPYVGAAVVVFAAWALLTGESDENRMETNREEVRGVPNPVMDESTEEQAVSLPDGSTLNVAENSLEDKCLQFIEEDQSQEESSWMTFDRVAFTEGMAKADGSLEQINNVAKILNANPSISCEIGGSESDDSQRLAKNRAEFVRDQLVSQGVQSERISVKGYGNPVAIRLVRE
ncbi:DUF937 domain-containing protein [Limibacter armeniacum]|uniref:DUF937 domain-containing protein n=1 Tax=Limibacter armeniacum TaxID=466084 RepID=UPI002FE5C877